jgi:hypothetical protein
VGVIQPVACLFTAASASSAWASNFDSPANAATAVRQQVGEPARGAGLVLQLEVADLVAGVHGGPLGGAGLSVRVRARAGTGSGDHGLTCFFGAGE